MTRASVAVVIVNANGGGLIRRTLACLERQTIIPDRTIVVDNASTDGSPAGLEERFPRVELIRLETNVGFAAANNLAVRRADDCRWVALLNPDAFPEERWLEALLGAADEHRDYAFFGSRLISADDPDTLDGSGDVYHASGLAWRRDHGLPVTIERARGEIFSPCAAAALYRRDAFLRAGGFDEAFYCYQEDNDLSFRLRLAGGRCLYVPDAVVHHVGSAIAGRTSDFTLYHQYRNLIWTYVKNMPAPLFWLYLPQHVLLQVALLVSFGLTGRARPILRGQRDALRALPRVFEQRREIQRRRTVSSVTVRSWLERGFGVSVTARARVRGLSASDAASRLGDAA